MYGSTYSLLTQGQMAQLTSTSTLLLKSHMAPWSSTYSLLTQKQMAPLTSTSTLLLKIHIAPWSNLCMVVPTPC